VRGLAAHGAAVALCLTPFAAVYGARGAALVIVVAAAHVIIDRWKVRATRRSEARALAEAHRQHESAATGDGLGAAWTPVPAALFLVDQLLHLAVLLAAWVVLIAPLAPLPEWTGLVDRVVVRLDPGEFHRWTLATVVVASLVIVNIRAGSLFVATLVRPRELVSGHHGPEPGVAAAPSTGAPVSTAPASALSAATPAASTVPASTGPAEARTAGVASASRGWRIRLGPLVATAEPTDPPLGSTPAAAAAPPSRAPAADASRPSRAPAADAPPPSRPPLGTSGSHAPPPEGHASPARIGSTIGILERLLIATFVLTGSTAAIGFVVAAKTLARFKQLDDRDFAEYYLLGTLASVAVALGSALVAQAALASLAS
jgi:hypothetical protein